MRATHLTALRDSVHAVMQGRWRAVVRSVPLAALLPVLLTLTIARPARAQRFEGIITMRVTAPRGSGERGGARSVDPGARGRGQSPPRTNGAGRGARGGDPNGAGRGAVGGEGRDSFTMPPEIEYMTRRGKVRIGLGGGSGGSSPGALIYAPEDGVMYTLFPAASMYLESAIPDVAAEPASLSDTTVRGRGGRRLAAGTPVVTHTKNFELIAGHRCEHVIVAVRDQKTDICMAKGLGAFIMPMQLGRAEAWQRAAGLENGFPLKVQQADGSVTMEVIKVERKSLAPSLFSVPEAYSRMPDITRRPPPDRL